MIERIHQTLDTVDGEVHQLTVKHRRGLIEQMPFNGAEDFERSCLSCRYLQPLIWLKRSSHPSLASCQPRWRWSEKDSGVPRTRPDLPHSI